MLARLFRMVWPERPHRQLDDWLPAVRASGRAALRETRDTRRERRTIKRRPSWIEEAAYPERREGDRR